MAVLTYLLIALLIFFNFLLRARYILIFRCRCSRCKGRTKKRHRYALLKNEEQDEEETIELKSGINHTVYSFIT